MNARGPFFPLAPSCLPALDLQVLPVEISIRTSMRADGAMPLHSLEWLGRGGSQNNRPEVGSEHRMVTVSSCIRQNRAERERLRALIERLPEGDLLRPLGEGWTIAVALAHLAFWDRRALAVLEEWENNGFAVWHSDWDATNAEQLASWQAIHPREAVREALEAAEAVDQKIESLDPALIDAIARSGQIRPIERWIHRREHLDQIERVLQGVPPIPRTRVSSGSPYEPRIGFSRAVRVGDRVLVAGTAPIWPDGHCDPDPGAQARRCLEIILDALREAGARAEHVVRTRVYLRSAEDADAVAAEHGAVFGDIRPVSTMIIVAGFLDPRWKVEIEAEAVIG